MVDFIKRNDVVLLIDVTKQISEMLNVPLREAVDMVYESISDETVFMRLPESGGLPYVFDERSPADLRCGFFNSHWWDQARVSRLEKMASEFGGRNVDLEDTQRLALMMNDAEELKRAIAGHCAKHDSQFNSPSDVVASEVISGDTIGRIQRAIAAFPGRYPEYKTKPPKLDDDVRPWLKEVGLAANDAERRVFGTIIREHFKLSGDTQKTQ